MHYTAHPELKQRLVAHQHATHNCIMYRDLFNEVMQNLVPTTCDDDGGGGVETLSAHRVRKAKKAKETMILVTVMKTLGESKEGRELFRRLFYSSYRPRVEHAKALLTLSKKVVVELVP